jgi:hypothetical protein
MALGAMLKQLSPDMLERAQAHALVVAQHIDQTNKNTEAIVQRLAAIDTGLAQIRATLQRTDAQQAAIVGRLDSLSRAMDAVVKAAKQLADEGE